MDKSIHEKTNQNRRPTFLGVGAARSGTTAIYDWMRRYPEIFIPEIKEIHFFTYRQLQWDNYRPLSYNDYLNYFKDGESFKVRGEISPSYLYFPGTAQKIYDSLGSIKIIIILRNPIERAISDYQYSIQYNQNKLDFNQFLIRGIDGFKNDSLYIDPFTPTAILWKGFYFQQIQEYLQLFGKKQIKILLFDDLVKDATIIENELCTFLKISPYKKIKIQKKNARSEKIKINAEARHILEDLYRQDIRKCAQIINRNLNHWLD